MCRILAFAAHQGTVGRVDLGRLLEQMQVLLGRCLCDCAHRKGWCVLIWWHCKDYLFRILREKCVRVERLKAFDCGLDDSASSLGVPYCRTLSCNDNP